MSDEYPEHDKLAKVSDRSQAIGEFLEWLGERESKVVLCSLERTSSGFYPKKIFLPIANSVERLLAEYFEIDLKVIEDEKRAMLDVCRKANQDGNSS